MPASPRPHRPDCPPTNRRTRRLCRGAALGRGTVRRQERELEAEIIQRLDAHSDVRIFTGLPRVGHGLCAAPLVAEIGGVRAGFPDEESLVALTGVAPVTRARVTITASGSDGPRTRSSATPSLMSPTTPAKPAPALPSTTTQSPTANATDNAVRILARP